MGWVRTVVIAPPQVLLEANGQVVFVGLHIDMYNGDWLVHEAGGSLFTPEANRRVSRTDCEMGLN
jgi:hypothetical protein